MEIPKQSDLRRESGSPVESKELDRIIDSLLALINRNQDMIGRLDSVAISIYGPQEQTHEAYDNVELPEGSVNKIHAQLSVMAVQSNALSSLIQTFETL